MDENAHQNSTDQDNSAKQEAHDTDQREEKIGSSKASQWITWLLEAAIDGVGPLDDVVCTSNRILAKTAGDKEQAIKQLTTSEMRTLGLTGFISGLGGLATMPVAMPADLALYQLRSTRLAACVAHLRGYDIASPIIRSLIVLSLAGEEGNRIAQRHAIELGSFESVGRMHDLPEAALKEMEQAVGLRLLAGAGVKGALNLVRFVPVLGGIASGAVNMLAVRDVVNAASKNFPAMS